MRIIECDECNYVWAEGDGECHAESCSAATPDNTISGEVDKPAPPPE